MYVSILLRERERERLRFGRAERREWLVFNLVNCFHFGWGLICFCLIYYLFILREKGIMCEKRRESGRFCCTFIFRFSYLCCVMLGRVGRGPSGSPDPHPLTQVWVVNVFGSAPPSRFKATPSLDFFLLLLFSLYFFFFFTNLIIL